MSVCIQRVLFCLFAMGGLSVVSGRGSLAAAEVSFQDMTARTPAAPHSSAYRRVGGSMLTLNAFARAYQLSLVSAPGSGRYELRDNTVRAIFVPGIAAFNLNGRAVRLPHAPRIVNGALRIPGAAAQYFRKTKIFAPVALAPIRGTVVLDPGHGGKDAGTSGNGLREKDVVLDVALRVAEHLRRRGVKVILTRGTDRFVSLGQRSRIANAKPNSIFVSIHANSPGKNTPQRHLVSGVETYVLSSKVSESSRIRKATGKYDLANPSGVGRMRPAEERRAIAGMSRQARARSKELAHIVQAGLLALGEKDRKVRAKNLHVLRENYFTPAILTEIGFLTHALTARKLASPVWREKFAQAIANSIATYLQKYPGAN